MTIPVKYMLRVFDKDSEELISKHEIRGVSLRELQQAFGVPEDDPMYDCWDVGPTQVEMLERATGVKIDLDKYYYQVGGVEA